jgi:hypothetical protein
MDQVFYLNTGNTSSLLKVQQMHPHHPEQTKLLKSNTDLAQPVYEDMILKLVGDYTNFSIQATRIGLLPASEDPWLVTKSLPNSDAVRALPTAFARIKREDAVCVILQGAQTASRAIALSEDVRNKIRDSLMSLR